MSVVFDMLALSFFGSSSWFQLTKLDRPPAQDLKKHQRGGGCARVSGRLASEDQG
jgi:hypothetical protein